MKTPVFAKKAELFSSKQRKVLSDLIARIYPKTESFIGGLNCGVVDYIETLLTNYPLENEKEIYLSSLNDLIHNQYLNWNNAKKNQYISEQFERGLFRSETISGFFSLLSRHGFDGIWYHPLKHNIVGQTGLTLLHYSGPQLTANPPFGYYDKVLPKQW